MFYARLTSPFHCTRRFTKKKEKKKNVEQKFWILLTTRRIHELHCCAVVVCALWVVSSRQKKLDFSHSSKTSEEIRNPTIESRNVCYLDRLQHNNAGNVRTLKKKTYERLLSEWMNGNRRVKRVEKKIFMNYLRGSRAPTNDNFNNFFAPPSLRAGHLSCPRYVRCKVYHDEVMMNVKCELCMRYDGFETRKKFTIFTVELLFPHDGTLAARLSTSKSETSHNINKPHLSRRTSNKKLSSSLRAPSDFPKRKNPAKHSSERVYQTPSNKWDVKCCLEVTKVRLCVCVLGIINKKNYYEMMI